MAAPMGTQWPPWVFIPITIPWITIVVRPSFEVTNTFSMLVGCLFTLGYGSWPPQTYQGDGTSCEWVWLWPPQFVF